MSSPVGELDKRKRTLQRRRQQAADRGRSTVMFDKLISATQRRMNELQGGAK